jgi:hypothetical protein
MSGKQKISKIQIKSVSNGFIVETWYVPTSVSFAGTVGAQHEEKVFRDIGEVLAWLRLTDNRWV